MIIYKSTDTSAPVLANTNGSMINLLDKCLVTGYGSKSGAGWTKEYTGTNLAVYKQGTGGNGRYLRVYDAGTSTYNSRCIQMRGYEAMTAISTGTGAFPTTGQISGNGSGCDYYYNGATTSPVWSLYASSNFFIFIADIYDLNKFYTTFLFGTFNSIKAGDIYNDVLCGANNTAGGGYDGISQDPGITTANTMWVVRNDLGVTGSKPAHLASSYHLTHIGIGTSASYPYPERTTSALLQAQPTIWCDGYRRGTLPGIWELAHNPTDVGGDGTTWSGGPDSLNGKTFQLITNINSSADTAYSLVIETSNTW